MKVSIIDDDNIIVFLNTFNTKNIDFENKGNIEKNFKKIFLKLKYIYKLNIKGYYNINIYKDKLYGAILKIEHEDIEYFDYFDSKVDMRVNVISNTFLYKIKDILELPKNLKENVTIYLFQDEFYIFLNRDLSNYNFSLLIEMSDIVYGNITNDILRLGRIINLK